ncbi:MAG TPA: protein kinase [Verrucomicrobiae bacterium]
MPIIPPDIDLVRQQFPQFSDLNELASGGFKVVYRVETAGRAEALKLIEIPNDPEIEDVEAFRNEMFGRTKREIEALEKCAIPELVKLGVLRPVRVTLGGREFVAYSEEFLDGPSLSQLIRENRVANRPPGEPELKMLMRAGLKTIKELWRNGYIHRDIKPLNVVKLGVPDRRFVFLDLGIAFSVIESSLTPNPAQAPGTLPYMAPEMFTADFRQHVDFKSDLYSLAVTVYMYACHRHPILERPENEFQTVSRLLRQRAIPLRSVRPALSAPFCSLVDQMLRKQPALRPSNITAMLAQMEEQP